jgi:lipopolysaccharide export system protein LptC
MHVDTGAFDGLKAVPAWQQPRRQPRSWHDARRHSRAVRILRIGLPALALLTVAWLIVSARAFPPTIGNVDLGEVGLDGTTLTMENPALSGYNENGTSYEVTAARALQDVTNPRIVTLQRIDGTMTKPDGTKVRVTAADGVYDSEEQTLKLSNDIVVRADDGSRAFLRSADVDMKAGSIVSTEPIRAETPGGRIRADTMDIAERGAHMLFKGKVVVELRLDGGSLDDRTARKPQENPADVE